MSKLNSQQKKIIKNIQSEDDAKKLKKLFKKVNKEKEIQDSKKLLKKLFKIISPKNKSNEEDKYAMTPNSRMNAITYMQELRNEFDKKQNVLELKSELQKMCAFDISNLTFTSEINTNYLVFYSKEDSKYVFSTDINKLNFSDKLMILDKISDCAIDLGIQMPKKGSFTIKQQ